jgi:16S rRNA (cytidine1402-2'-O)-methyltransferase
LGALYLVATPIGNLEDITLRALRILREQADVIACEDTRRTQKLLEHYDIRKPLVSYHEHNEQRRAAELIERMKEGASIALVSDAGTPLISDPGFRLVSQATACGIPVIPVPGPSALLGALSASGLPAGEFRFTGFLPAKAAARRKLLHELALERATVVVYEAPHRILESLAEMETILGDRRIVLAREITKVHEEFLRGTPAEVRKTLAERPALKGEITLVIAGSEEQEVVEDPVAEIWRLESEEGLDRMSAIKAVARRMGLPKREVYRLSEATGSNSARKHRD